MDRDLPKQTAFLENFAIQEEVGKGSFATVCSAIHNRSGKKVAVKIVDKSSLKTEQAQNRFVREITMMKQMDHPFITKLYDIYETDTAYNLVMEYVDNGTMLDLIRSKNHLNESLARRYFSQLISVLDYLHNERHICHRDLKPENIMLDSNNNIRLIDFGLSNFFTVQSPLLQTACGSPAYAAPEMLKRNKYTKAADIWSAGVLLFTMVTGKLPFYDKDMKVMLRKIISEQPTFPETISFNCQQLIRQMLLKLPQDRIKLSMIKEHPWIEESEYKELFKYKFSIDKRFTQGFSGDMIITEEDLDLNIVEELNKLGFNTSSLCAALNNGEYDEMISIYRMMKREKEKEELHKLMKGIDDRQQQAPVINHSQMRGGARSFMPMTRNERANQTQGTPLHPMIRK
ncbi:CAMK family protein kinase [Histomonas meleagridis]|uniref:CAMK family protein kinase n=1 Tax=Histomonas meleagridis TaxID=135588 RepID=UPI00355AA1AE|nr:CAMK family protein kinase [Histomonas meleagridis]KAH0797233.1 CAMK family protein kinase [Histomonas meleagridis]